MAKLKTKKRERREWRFFPQSNANPLLLRVVGGLGAMALGAGAWAQFMSVEPSKWTPGILAAGAFLFGLALWLGTSGDPILRVGDGGVGVDRGIVRRIPWHAVEAVTWSGGAQTLVVKGVDESEKPLVVEAKLKSQPAAVAFILKEARARIPDQVEAPEAIEGLPEPADDDGEELPLEALQVAGRRCAESDKAIAFESDARVCPRCERVYHKAHVPSTCACGASLAGLRERGAPPDKSAKGKGAKAKTARAAESESESEIEDD